MQPGVTVTLAMVWLAVAGVVGAVTLRPLRLTHDQYSSASPRRHGFQRDQIDWRDRDSAEDQPLDLWINLRRSTSAKDSSGLSRNAERNLSLEKPLKDVALSKQIFPTSGRRRRLPNIAKSEFTADKVDYGEMPETLSREMLPSDLDDPFVADDTFQDQGPGSVEIYKLDLSKEKALLTAPTPSARLPPAKNKSKAPKKTGRVTSKAKTTEVKSTSVSPKTHHRQSNFFEEQRTEMSVNRDAFGVGGVPELQVGCEGLEASSHKAKRSIDTLKEKEKKEEIPASWLNVTPITLDLNYVVSYDDEDYEEMDADYEEMDELKKLIKLEENAKTKPNRGDMDAILHFDHLDNSREPEKLPVRGDLGESSSGLVKLPPESKIGQNKSRKLAGPESGSRGRRLLWLAEANTEGFADDERKRVKRSIDWGFGEDEGVVSSNELQTVNERRRQHEMRHHQDARRREQQHELNSDINNIRQEYERQLEQKRREEEERLRRMQQGGRRTPDRWEEEEQRKKDEMRRQYEEYRRKTQYTSTPRTDDEEFQRRQMEERRKQEAARNQTQEMDKRNEEERRRREEEERRRRMQEDRWQEEERRRQEENARKSGSSMPQNDNERIQRLHNEEMRRRQLEDLQRQLQKKETWRQEQYRSQQEAQRRREEEERRRASQEDPTKNLSEGDRRRLEQQRREWWEKKRQEQEDERRRQQGRDRNEDVPSNLMRANHPNNFTQRDRDQERRAWEEKDRKQKLQEYIARNQPINVNQTDRQSEEKRRRGENANRDDEEYRRRAEEERKRQKEERKLLDYIKRNQPVNVPSRSDQSIGRDWFHERRRIEDIRQRSHYPDSGAERRRGGPSAPTNIDPRSSPEEVRRRQEARRRLEEERQQGRERQQWYEAEQRRKELARRQQEEEERRLQEERRKEEARREEETRREQSRRYEEERKRQEATRMQAERSRQEMLRERTRNVGQVAGKTRQWGVTRSPYHHFRLEEHRRRQDSQPIPSNLVRNETRRLAERERQRQEQARLEAERRRQEETRIKEQRMKEMHADQQRQAELLRLDTLPVKARIIVSRDGSSSSTSPVVISRFGNDIDFMGINPSREGVKAAKFPAPPTTRPPVQSPPPCIWAIVQCCSNNNNRLLKCFESLGCPRIINWDDNPCRASIVQAARTEIMKFYAAAENE